MLILIILLTSLASAVTCSLGSDFTQTGDNSTCDILNTNAFTWDTAGFDLIVTGNVTVNSPGGKLQGRTGDHVFGGLGIISGAEYNGSSKSTRITGKAANSRCIDFKTGSTFRSNNGIIHLSNTVGSCTMVVKSTGGNIHDLIVSGGTVSWDTSATLWTVNGDLRIDTGSTLQPTSATRRITLSGDANITGTFGSGTQTGDNAFGSVTVNSGGTFEGTTGTTTITSENAAGYAFDNDGTLTANSGTLTITTPSTTLIDAAGSGNIHKLTLNHASLHLIMDTSMTVADDLTITSGLLNTSDNDYTLTVTGDTSITGTLTCGGSSVNLRGAGVTVNSGGTFVGGSGSHNIWTFTALSGSTSTLTSGRTTVDLNAETSWRVDNGATYSHGNGEVFFNSGGIQDLYRNGNTALEMFYDLTLDSCSKLS